MRHFSSFLSALFLASLLLLGTACSNMKDSPAGVVMKAILPKVEKLKLQPGFEAEHLYSPSENGQGSWVAMAFDGKGRMIASDQYGGLYRLEIPPQGAASRMPRVEKLEVNMGRAQGLLWAFNSLYVVVNHTSNEEFSKSNGLYRLEDTDNDDQFDKVTMLKEFTGDAGEHGPHSVVLAPDGQSLYVVAGNHIDVPEMNSYRIPPVWQEDNLFPQIKDPRGHANHRMAPGGWIARVDPQGKHWELVSVGFRNSFDLAFNEAGDLFTYDSDMEWDFGLPWYRPTRICHVTSGSEFGWRTGSGKWSPHFPDNMPAVLNIGQGSPTGLLHGKEAAFPEKYKRALFAFDWSFGIIYAVHLKPEGASYTAQREEFLSGMPLPLTDGVIGPDGALYFLTGGRRLESDLYRVSYKGPEKTDVAITAPNLPEAHTLRKRLEGYHGKKDPAAIDIAWPYLKHPDRFVRYAASMAVENQPVYQWQTRVLQENDAQILTQGMIALARHANKNLKNQMLKALATVPYEKLSEYQRLDVLRAFELIFARMGQPDPPVKQLVINYLNPLYPATSEQENRELSKSLVFLEAPKVIERTLALLEQQEPDASPAGGETATSSADLIHRNPQYGLDIAGMLSKVPPARQTYLATVLSSQKSGWTPELQERYFSWFHQAFTYKGGNSYIGFIDKARKRALEHVPKDRFAHLNILSGDTLLSSSGNDLLVKTPRPKGPGRNWGLAEALPLVATSLEGRDFEQGKNMFVATMCHSCHSMQGEGGNVGPDLSQLGTRFTPKDMLEAIINPNKAISDQYAATVLVLKDGSSVVGRLINENRQAYFVSQNPFAPDVLREVPKKDVTTTKVSKVSLMMPGLINSLNDEELKDLMAYLMAGGRKEHPVFQTREVQVKKVSN
jgi:putative heme-binding domain-containing protein